MTPSSPLPAGKRHRTRDASGEAVTGGRQAAVAMGLMWALCLFAVFSAGAPVSLSRGMLFVLAGTVMLLLPPRTRLPAICYVPAAAFLIFASCSFLPADWFASREWREALRAEGLETGSMVTAHPRQSLEQLFALAVTVVTGLYIFSQKISGKAARLLALLFPAGVAVYAGVSILAMEQGWKMAWDTVPDFGFFPNRNHTATLLTMGLLTAVAGLFQSVKSDRGGMAGLFAISGIVCLWALAGYNLSRAGLLLTLLGLVAWVLFLGKAWITRRVLVVLAVFAAAGGGLFWMADTGIKARLSGVTKAPPAVRTGADDIPRTLTAEGQAADFRLLVYRDTLAMIAREPWTGCGPGMFRFVFPQYRWYSSTANNSRCVHPESDWLMVAAESGVPAMLTLAAGVGVVLVMAFRGARKRNSWPLRLGCLIAAAVVPVHGIIDVPGHLPGLTWSAVFLLALTMRDFGGQPFAAPAGRWIWRLAGLAIMVPGVLLLRAEWFGGSPSALAQPQLLTHEALALHALDQAEQSNPPPPGENPDPAEGEDLLETALSLVDQALQIAPLDQELHYLKGSLSLFFTDKEAAAAQSYSIQRKLEPRWVRLPLRQAFNWSRIDAKQTAALWEEGLRRAESLESIAPGTFMNRQQVFSEIMNQAADDPELSTLATGLISPDSPYLEVWAARAARPALNAGMPGFLERSSPNNRESLYQTWSRRDPSAAEAWKKDQGKH